jgi:hypothetical protein
LGHRLLPLGSQAPDPWVTGSCPLGHKLLPLGSQALAPWVTGSCPLGRRLLPLGSQALAPWVTGSCPLGHRLLPLGSQAPDPWVTGSCPLGHKHLPHGSQASDPYFLISAYRHSPLVSSGHTSHRSHLRKRTSNRSLCLHRHHRSNRTPRRRRRNFLHGSQQPRLPALGLRLLHCPRNPKVRQHHPPIFGQQHILWLSIDRALAVETLRQLGHCGK